MEVSRYPLSPTDSVVMMDQGSYVSPLDSLVVMPLNKELHTYLNDHYLNLNVIILI